MIPCCYWLAMAPGLFTSFVLCFIAVIPCCWWTTVNISKDDIIVFWRKSSKIYNSVYHAWIASLVFLYWCCSSYRGYLYFFLISNSHSVKSSTVPGFLISSSFVLIGNGVDAVNQSIKFQDVSVWRQSHCRTHTRALRFSMVSHRDTSQFRIRSVFLYPRSA